MNFATKWKCWVTRQPTSRARTASAAARGAVSCLLPHFGTRGLLTCSAKEATEGELFETLLFTPLLMRKQIELELYEAV